MSIFLTYAIFSVISIFYSYNCYKKQKIIYTVNKHRLYVSDEKYYTLQFKFGCLISFLFLLMGLLNLFNPLLGRYMTILTLLITIVLFWIINSILQDIAQKKSYLKIKE